MGDAKATNSEDEKRTQVRDKRVYLRDLKLRGALSKLGITEGVREEVDDEEEAEAIGIGKRRRKRETRCG